MAMNALIQPGKMAQPDKPKTSAASTGVEYTIAKYLRLSLEDGITESLSIPHQRMLLDAHIDELEIPNATVLEFVDNGYSGTNMSRQALQEMLDLVRSGRVNCIVVKDFSRFSRNALESGYYIEQVFPLFQTRFISVSDRFDSRDYMNDTGGIDVAFKFLMHEYYSKDLSIKIKSAKRIKMVRGENIVATTIYGYYKDEHGKWEPEDFTADVVRMIYSFAMEGMPPTVIKDKLFEMGCPTPREHQELKRGKDIVPACHWEARAVHRTLTNLQYTGVYISGKQESKAVGSHSKKLTDKSEWIVIPGNHTPIIEKDVFDRVQELLDKYIGRMTTQKPINETWKDDVTPLVDENPLAKSQSKYPKRRRMIKGEFIAATALYGYTKTGGGCLEIDTQAADIIKGIFDSLLRGLSETEIAEGLSAAKIPMPREHMDIAKGKAIEPTFGWRTQNVRNILVNIQYTGAYVSGRILKDGETGKKYRPAKDDWIVIPGKHPAIIEKEMFDRVQAVMADNTKYRKKNKKTKDFLLRSKVKCGCCGKALVYDAVSDPVFRCYQAAANPSAPCHKMKVVVRELDEAVIDIIMKQAEVILNTSEMPNIRKTTGSAQQIAECESQIKSLVELRQTYYEQFVTQEINRETHKTLRADCADKIHVFPGNHLEIAWKVAGFAAGI